MTTFMASLTHQLAPGLQECPAFFKTGNAKTQAALCPVQYANLAIQTTAAVGILEMLFSVLQLGFLIKFLGQPVVSGFMAGSAVLIMFSQLKDVFGINVPNVNTVQDSIRNINAVQSTINGYVILLWCIWFAYILSHKFFVGWLKQWVDKRCPDRRRLRFALLILEPLGPLISIIIGGLVVQGSPQIRKAPWSLGYVGTIPQGTPPWSGNVWQGVDLGRVLPTAITAFLVGDLEAISIAKNTAAKNGYTINPPQELFAQGITNIVGACFSCYASTGSFSRTAVNEKTGAKTQLAGAITAIVMLFTLLFLTPLFFFVPKFCLAAIIVSAVGPLINPWEAWRIWTISKLEFLVYLACAVAVMFWGVVEGIGLAVGLSMCLIIYETARPQLQVLWRLPGTTYYSSIKQESNGVFVPGVFISRISFSLYFANITYVKDMLLTHIKDIQAGRAHSHYVCAAVRLPPLSLQCCRSLRLLRACAAA